MSADEVTGFLGLSHLGIVSSIGWASFGEPVVAVDLDPAPVEALAAGRVPVHEPGLTDLFGRVRARMTFSTDPAALATASLVIVARDVPTDSADASDPAAVLRLIDAALPHLREGVTLVVMSQVPPGFTRRLADRIRARRPGLAFSLYYWIETLIFGNAVARFREPERLMVGALDPTAPLSAPFAAGLERFRAPIFRMAYESAELTKTAINLYLCAAVTYANTMSDLCEAVGADWTEMVPALRLDRRIGPAAYIKPGLGIAGGNLERDMITLRDLCRGHGVDGSLIDTMLAYNAVRYRWVQTKLAAHLRGVPAPVIAVWGLAYKKNTHSTKNSVALRVIAELQGRAEVRAWDPVVRAGDVDVAAKIVGDRDEALVGADCLLVLTDWDEFAAPSAAALATMRRRLIIDGVGVVDRSRPELRDVLCVAMGRPAAP